LQNQEKCDKRVLELADNMASTLSYIEDVEQFARLPQLKKAIEEVWPLMEETTNIVLKYTSRGGAGMCVIIRKFPWVTILSHRKGVALGSLIKGSRRD
jgi:hypothetical protein